MTTPRASFLSLAFSLLVTTAVSAQRPADVDAINRLLDQYAALDDAMDMPAQAKLMSQDRVWIAPGAGRRTDQALNMRIQQAAYDGLKKQAPGIQTFSEDRDRLIKFYANGAVAVASFYRYTTAILPPNAPADLAAAAAPPPSIITLVLERRQEGWRIVHTHVSELSG